MINTNKTTSGFLHVIIFILLAFPVFVNAQTRDDLFQQGLFRIRNGEYGKAEELFKKVIENDPENAAAYFYKGNCNVFLKNYKQAEKDFSQALKKGYKESTVNVQMGYMYNEAGAYKKAIKYFNKVIEANKEHVAEAYNNRGNSYQYLKNIHAALNDYNKAIQLDSNLALAYNNRGSATYYNQDIEQPSRPDIERAIKDFSKAVQINPYFCTAWSNKGLGFIFLKQYDSAVATLDKAIHCNDANPRNYLNRGMAKAELNKDREAITDIQTALQLHSNLPEAYIEAGKVYLKMGDYDKAKENFNHILDRFPDYSPPAYYYLARTYALQNDKDKMIINLEKARESRYFAAKNQREDFLKDKAFEGFLKDEDFKKLSDKIRSGQ